MPESIEHILKSYLDMPADFWVKVLIAAVVLVLLLTVLKKMAHVGQVIAIVLVFFAMGVIGYKWVRYRGEPEFMTPVVDFVASFFPKPVQPPAPASPEK